MFILSKYIISSLHSIFNFVIIYLKPFLNENKNHSVSFGTLRRHMNFKVLQDCIYSILTQLPMQNVDSIMKDLAKNSIVTLWNRQ